jgi:hypothetical protein
VFVLFALLETCVKTSTQNAYDSIVVALPDRSTGAGDCLAPKEKFKDFFFLNSLEANIPCHPPPLLFFTESFYFQPKKKLVISQRFPTLSLECCVE